MRFHSELGACLTLGDLIHLVRNSDTLREGAAYTSPNPKGVSKTNKYISVK